MKCLTPRGVTEVGHPHQEPSLAVGQQLWERGGGCGAGGGGGWGRETCWHFPRLVWDCCVGLGLSLLCPLRAVCGCCACRGRCWHCWGGDQAGCGCWWVPASGLEKAREHRAELPATPNQPVIVSIMKINWPLLPKINVSVPNPHFNSTSSLEMHIIWLQSHTF